MESFPLTLSPFWGFFLSILLILLNGFFVAAEFAIVKVRRTRVAEMASKGSSKALLVQKITHKLDEYLSATQLGITLASIALGWIGEPVFAELLLPLFQELGSYAMVSAHTASFFTAFIFITFLHVVVGELIPKSIAIQQAERVSLFIAYPLWIFDKVFFPVLGFLNQVSTGILKLFGFRGLKESPLSEEELRLILAESSKEGVVSPAELMFMKHALTFSDKRALNILISKDKLHILHEKDPFEVQYKKVAECPHTRFPVVDEGKVIGLVRIQSVLTEEAETFQMSKALQPILEFDDGTKIDHIFQIMKEKKIYMAAVYSKSSEWLGIITITDIIEEIMGQVG